MQDASQSFFDLITCIAMQYGNFEAALYCEQALKTNAVLQQEFYARPAGSFSKNTFLTHRVAINLLPGIFYPVPNQEYMQRLMLIYHTNANLIALLTEQYDIQLIWEKYFEAYLNVNFITRDTVQALRKIIPYEFLSKCDSVKFSFAHFFLPQQVDLQLNARLTAAFANVLAEEIRMDDVPDNADCFFKSIENQFVDALPSEKQNQVSVKALRAELQDFATKNFKSFVPVVQSWMEMYDYALTDAFEWEFLRPYMRDKQSALQVAKKLVNDKVMESRHFWADVFAVDVIVEYISKLFQRDLLIVVLDLSTETWYSSGFHDLEKCKWVSFLVCDQLRYFSCEIQGKRFFAKGAVPQTNLPFLK